MANNRPGGTLGAMSPEKRREIQSLGGQASQKKGVAPGFTKGKFGTARKASLRSWELHPDKMKGCISSAKARATAFKRWGTGYGNLSRRVRTPKKRLSIVDLENMWGVHFNTLRNWRKRKLLGPFTTGQFCRIFIRSEDAEKSRRRILKFLSAADDEMRRLFHA